MLNVGPHVFPSSSRHADAVSPSPRDLCRIISACVAFDYGLVVAELEAGLRGSRRAAFARQIAMYLAHVGFGLSFDCIGGAFGRDRTTVAHACRVVEDGRDDIWFDCRVATLELICRTATGGANR